MSMTVAACGRRWLQVLLTVLQLSWASAQAGCSSGSGARDVMDSGTTPRDAALPARDAAQGDGAAIKHDAAAVKGDAAVASHDAAVVERDAAAVSDDAATTALPDRPLLAASGAQLRVTGPRLGLQLTAADLASDADVFAIHQEFYGVPWQAFETSTAPPAEWTALMQELATTATAAKKPVFLSINMLNGARERLAATTRIENGQVKTSDDTGARCYDFNTAGDGASKRAAYLRYVEVMVERFQPAFLNIAIEVNLFFEKCPAAVASLIEVINAAYDAAKAKRAATLVFPSFQIDHLYGYSKDSCPDAMQRAKCFDDHYAQLTGIKRDRFAMSSYPFLNQIASPSALPADWFERGAVRANEKPLIVETGWLATPLSAKRDSGSCFEVFDYDEAASETYLRRVLTDAARLDIELVTWWSDRDLVPTDLMTNCPCTFDAMWCTVLDVFRGPDVPAMPETRFVNEVLLKAFGTMGLRRYDGTPRAGHLEAWMAARK